MFRISKFLVILFLVNFIITVAFGHGTHGGRELVFTQVLCRHGVRAPLDSYPNDPFHNESYWPNGLGGLTELGKLGAQELGVFLRHKYHHFLSERFSDKEVHVVSSDYDRSIISAQALLSGLYNSNEGIWDLFPVHTIPPEYDSLIQPKVHNSNVKNVYQCPKYSKLVKDIMLDSKENQDYTQANLELFEFFRNHSGKPMERLTQAASFIGTLIIEDMFNMTIPIWAKQTITNPETLKTTAQVFKFLTYTDEMKRLAAGPLLSRMIQNMKNKISGSDQGKMYVYSGHDLILGNMMDTLGIYEPPHWIDFSSALILELYYDNSTKNALHHTIQVLYRKKTRTEPILMEIPGCRTPCKLDVFLEVVKPYIPEDLVKECEIGKTSTRSRNSAAAHVQGLSTDSLTPFKETTAESLTVILNPHKSDRPKCLWQGSNGF